MRIARLVTGLALALASIYLQAQSTGQEITASGRLDRAMAVGGESTGWILQLDLPIVVAGNHLSSIQVNDPRAGELETWANKRVRVTGKLGQRTGVETGEQPVLTVSSIKAVRPSHAAYAPKAPIDLSGSEWLLDDLAGSTADHGQATLTFPEAGKVAGNASCNRFFASAEINGNAIKLGGMGSTRMACPEPVMKQEANYLEALQVAERFEWKDPYLLIYCQGLIKPLRFTRMQPAKPATP